MTAPAARRWTTGASGEEGRRRRSGWGLGAAEIGDDGAVGRRSSGRRSGTADLRAALGDGGPRDWRRSAAAELGRRVLWWRGTAALRDNDGGEQEAVGAGDGGGTSEAEIKN